eukprot:augustus_masked-scaffold_57-processed-gene-0.54-mRNA-1 protein AED:1.00 eAED:1.00 QI:0/0/0/0/1/1/5/0/2940
MTDRQKRNTRRDKIKKKEEEERLRREEEAQDKNIQDENVQDENVQDESDQDESDREIADRDGSADRDEEAQGAADEEAPTQAEELGAEDAASAEAEEAPASDEEEDVVTPAGEKRTADEAHHLNMVVTGTGSPDRRGVAGGPNISTEELLLQEGSGAEVSGANGADNDENSDDMTSGSGREDEEAVSATSRRSNEVVTLTESIRPIGVDLVAFPDSESAPRSGVVGKKQPQEKFTSSPKRSEILEAAQQLIFPSPPREERTPTKKAAPPASSPKERIPSSKGGAETDLTGDAPGGGGKKTPKKPRKKSLAKRDCEFYTKVPRYFTPSIYVVCEDDLREAQKKMDGQRAVDMLESKNVHRSSKFPLLLMIALSEAEVDDVPLTERVAHMLAAVPNFRENKEVSFGQLASMRKRALIRLLATNTPTWFFHSSGEVIAPNIQYMADRGLAVLNGRLSRPNVGIREDPTRPRRVKLFRWVVKADPHLEKSLLAPKPKVRRSEHQLTDKESRLQSRIDSLTNKNERLRAQAHAAENVLRDKNMALMKMAIKEAKKKHKDEMKRLLDEVKNLKGLYQAEKLKNQGLQQEVFDRDSVVEKAQRRYSNPGSQMTQTGTIFVFAEVRSIAAATQGSVHTLETRLNSMAALLEKLTEASVRSLERNARGSEELRRSEELRARRDESARRDRQWKNTGGKFKTLTSLKVKDIRAMLDMREAYLEVYENEREPNLWIHVDPELKQSLSRGGVTKDNLVAYLKKYMREHEAYEGEDTLRTIVEKVIWLSEGAFLERLNNYMNGATGCIKWNQLTENSQRFEILRTLNKRLPLQLRLKDDRIKAKLEAPGSKLADSLQEWKKLIQAIYDARLNMEGEVTIAPPSVADDVPRTSDVRRAAPKSKGKRKKKNRRYSTSSEESVKRSRKYPRRKSRSRSPYRGRQANRGHNRARGYNRRSPFENRSFRRNEGAEHEGRRSFLALPAPGDDRKRKKERGFMRRLNVSVRRTARNGVTIHHTASGDRIPNAILDSGADESVASLYRHAWMMDSIKDVKEKITLADGTTDLRVTEVGYADLEMRVGGIWKRDFRRVKVFLVDDEKWKEILVAESGPACLKVCSSCFANSAEVVDALMSRELGQLSGVYRIVVVEVDLKLILTSISNFAEYGYTLAETVRVLDEGADGNLLINSYFVFTKDLDLVKLRRQKSKDVQFLTGLRLPRLRLAAMIRQLGGGKMEILNDIPAIRAASIDFSRRFRDGNAEAIPFGETIHLKQNKDVVDEDNLEQLMLPEGNALYWPEAEKAEIREAITKMVEAAGDANEDQRNQLMDLCFKYEDVFATSALQIGISLLPPMDVVPIEGAEFKMPAPRPLGPGKAEFVKEKLDGMVEKGMAKKIRQAIYGSVVFAVPKKNNTWRMVLDLVAVNKVLHRDANILPLLETQLGNTAPARFYGCLDVISGFDQLAITDRAKKYFNLMTTYGVFQLQFAPMGYHSTPVFFHQRMVDHIAAANYNKEGNGIVQWIDDTLIHAKDFRRYIRILEDVLRNLRKWKVRICPTKSILFATSIEYCGRVLQNGGWNFSKKYYEKNLLVPKPEYVYELAKLLHLAQWLTSAVPEMAELRDKIMLFYPEMKGKKKKLLKEKKRILWNEELEAAFKRFKQRLAKAAKARLQHYDRNMDLILVTDASDKCHSAILFQARQEERGKDLLKKTVYPMMFFSGNFDASQLVWGICHKELYPIIRTFNKLSYLLPFHPTAVQVYTDHLNLKAILQGGSKINHGHLNRLQRWMVILQHVLVDIHHVDEDSNIFADMLTRWAAPTEVSSVAAVRMVKMHAQNAETEVPVLARAEKRLRKISKMLQEETEAKIRKWLKEAVVDALSIYTARDGSLLGEEDLYFRIKRDFEGWTPDLLQPKKAQWVQGLERDIGARYFVQPSLAQQKRIIRRILRKPAPPRDRTDLMREVERQIQKEYSKEEWEKLTEDFATWPSEVPSDVSDTRVAHYIETDTYSTSEEEDNTTAKIRNVTVRVNHFRPKKQMEKKIYASLKTLDKYRVSVFNPYFEGDWAPLTEAEVIEAQKKEMITRTSRIKKLFEWRIPAAMERTLRGDTPWKKMVELIRAFRDNCIHCRRLPKAIKTTYSLVTRARRPRETLVADFLCVNRMGHILVLTDAFSRFMELTHTKTPDTQAVIEALERFAANYKLEKDFTLVTDRGSHFANSLMTALRKELRFSQSFAVSYASWTNGEVEVVNKKVLNFLKSLVSEYRLNEDEWPKILNKIQGAMNELPVPSRKIPGRKNAPTVYELFLYVNPERQYIEPAVLPPIVERIRGGARMLVGIDDDVLYKLSSAFRKRLDDYEGKRDKLALEWSGPVQIVEIISKNVYKIKALDGKATEVHGSRLYFYEPSGFVPSEALRKIYVGNFKHLEVAKFGDVKYDPHLAEYVIEVRWRGFRSEDNTWEPVQVMYEDVRNALLEHLGKETRRLSQNKMRKRAKQALVTTDHATDRVIRRVPGLGAWRRHLDKVKEQPFTERRQVASAKGWTKEEKQELRKLVLKFGVGRYDKYQLYLPHKTKAMTQYYIQQRLGRLDLEEIGGEYWDIEKARKSSERISRADFRCTRRFADCEQALALANEEVAKEFMPEYAEDLRRHRQKAADYVRRAARICEKLKQYPELIRTMVLAFEEEKVSEWGVGGFRVRYERHAEHAQTPMSLTNYAQEIEQSAKWRYLVSFDGEVQFTMIQRTGRIFDIDFEKDGIAVRGCILPPEKMWYNIDPYSFEWRQKAQGLATVDLLLADLSGREHREGVESASDEEFRDFGIADIRPRFAAVWIPRQELRRVFQFMESAGKNKGIAWTIIPAITRSVVLFKRCDALGELEMAAIQERKVLFDDRSHEGIKPLVVLEWIRRAFGDGAILMEIFARLSGLRKGWLQLGGRVNSNELGRSYEIQLVLRQSGVTHLWEEGDVLL